MGALWYRTPSSLQHCRNCPRVDKTARLAVCETFVPTEGLPEAHVKRILLQGAHIRPWWQLVA